MIDRIARNQLITAIELYMNETLTAFQFDSEMTNINTKDATVNWAIHDLWYIYDDVTDHYIIADAELWNNLNRMVLYLKSDCEISKELRKKKKFSSLEQALYPFKSITELRAAMELFPEFKKSAFNTALDDESRKCLFSPLNITSTIISLIILVIVASYILYSKYSS